MTIKSSLTLDNGDLERNVPESRVVFKYEATIVETLTENTREREELFSRINIRCTKDTACPSGWRCLDGFCVPDNRSTNYFVPEGSGRDDYEEPPDYRCTLTNEDIIEGRGVRRRRQVCCAKTRDTLTGCSSTDEVPCFTLSINTKSCSSVCDASEKTFGTAEAIGCAPSSGCGDCEECEGSTCQESNNSSCACTSPPGDCYECTSGGSWSAIPFDDCYGCCNYVIECGELKLKPEAAAVASRGGTPCLAGSWPNCTPEVPCPKCNCDSDCGPCKKCVEQEGQLVCVDDGNCDEDEEPDDGCPDGQWRNAAGNCESFCPDGDIAVGSGPESGGCIGYA